MHREHPLCVVRYSVKNIWLLIFPLLRGVYSFRPSPEALVAWVRGAWFDVLVLLVILGFGWLKWYVRTFQVQDGIICVYDGIVFRKTRCLPVERLSALTMERPLWLAPFGAMYLNADTAAGVLTSTDLRLVIRRRDAGMFLDVLPKVRQGKRHGYRRNVSFVRSFLFSALFSSSLYGSLYVALFFVQGGRIVRDLLEELQLQRQLGLVSEEVARHLVGIPPAAVTVALVVLGMWLLSFFTNLLRYSAFHMESDRRRIRICSGVVNPRESSLQGEKINYVDLRQNLPSKLMGLYTLAISCAGYGNFKGSIPVCLPLLTRKELVQTLPLLFPNARMTKNTLQAPLTSCWGFVWLPVLLMAAVVPTAWVLRQLVPAAADVIGFLRLMLMIPIVWKLLVQLLALLTNGVSMTPSQICLRYCRGFVFHTVIAGLDKVVKVRIRQQPWHRLFGKCHVDFYVSSEVSSRCTLRNVDIRKAKELLETFGRDVDV